MAIIQPEYAQEVAPSAHEIKKIELGREVGLWETATTAAETEWIDPAKLIQPKFTPQDGFRVWREGVIDKYTTQHGSLGQPPKKLTEENTRRLVEEDPQSPEEAQYIADQLFVDQEQEELLAGQGITGQGVRLAVSMIDPIALLTTVATDGAAAPWILYNKLGKARRIGGVMARTALVSGSTEALLSAMRMRTDLTYDANDAAVDVLLTAGLGAAIGGGAYAWQNSKAAGNAFTGTKAAYAENSETIKRHTDLMVEDIDRNTLQQTAVDIGDEVAANQLAIDQEQAELSYESPANFTRQSDFANSTKMKSQTAREFGGSVLEDATGEKTVHTIGLEKERLNTLYNTKLIKAVRQPYLEWTREQGYRAIHLRPFESNKLQNQFNDMVYRVVDSGVTSGNKQVDKAARDIQQMYREYADHLVRTGVADSETFTNSNYIARFYSDRKITKLFRENGDDLAHTKMERVFTGALRNANPDWDDAFITMLSKGLSVRIGKRVRGFSSESVDDWLSSDEALKELFTDAGFTTEQVKEAMSKAAGKVASKDKSSKPDRLKKRLNMDSTFISDDNLSLYDLIDTNAVNVTQRYLNNMTAWSALRQSKWGITGKADLDKLEETIRREAFEAGGNPDKEAMAFKRWNDELFGRPISSLNVDEGGQIASVLRSLTRYNYVRGMGMAWMMNLTEINRAVWQNGFLTTLNHLPKPQLKLLGWERKGDSFNFVGADRALIDEANTWNVSIGDDYHHRMFSNYEDEGLFASDEGLIGSADVFTQNVARNFSVVSLLAPVDRMTRQWSFAAAMDKATQALKAGKGGIYGHSFESMGLSKDVVAKLRKYAIHAEYEKGLAGTSRLKQMNYGKWVNDNGDVDWSTIDTFGRAMYRLNAHQIQKALIGESNWAMDTAVGKVIFQFRRFAIEAWEKHTLHSAKNITNPYVIGSALTSMMLGTLFYGWRLQLSSLGRDDREAYLYDKLEPTNQLIAGASYAPSLGMLYSIYGLTSAFLPLPDAGVVRSSQNPSMGIFMNPTFNLLDNVAKSTQGVSSLIMNGEMDDSEQKAITSLLPFGTLMGVNGVLNALNN
ncbi:hypothetical protein HYO13_11105 [Vibrio parahaemolyticus]|nr:hypothetical protein [Vibrio parahaemolyticus]